MLTYQVENFSVTPQIIQTQQIKYFLKQFLVKLEWEESLGTPKEL